MHRDHFSSAPNRIVGGALIGGGFALFIKLVELVRTLASQIGDVPQPAEWRTATLVMAGIVLSGAVGGWLLPYARSRVGAAVVGLMVVQPFVAASVLSYPGFRLTDVDTWLFWCMVTLLFGPFVGLVLVRDYLLNVIGVRSTP